MSVVSTVNLGSHPDLAGNLEMWGFEKRSKLTKVPLKKKKKPIRGRTGTTYVRPDPGIKPGLHGWKQMLQSLRHDPSSSQTCVHACFQKV